MLYSISRVVESNLHWILEMTPIVFDILLDILSMLTDQDKFSTRYTTRNLHLSSHLMVVLSILGEKLVMVPCYIYPRTAYMIFYPDLTIIYWL